MPRRRNRLGLLLGGEFFVWYNFKERWVKWADLAGGEYGAIIYEKIEDLPGFEQGYKVSVLTGGISSVDIVFSAGTSEPVTVRLGTSAGYVDIPAPPVQDGEIARAVKKILEGVRELAKRFESSG